MYFLHLPTFFLCSIEFLKSELNQIVIGFALVDVSLHYGVVLHSWIWVLQRMFKLLQSCFVARLYHQKIWNMEDLERVFWCFLNEEVEWLKVLRLSVLQGLSVHAAPPVVLCNWHVFEVGHEHIAVILDDFAALTQNILEHVKRVDEGGNCVGKHDTVDLLRKCEILVKNVCANQLELVDDALLSQYLLRIFDHLRRDVKSVDFLCSFCCQLLPDRAWSATHLQECLALNAFFFHLVESRVVAITLHEEVLVGPFVVCVGSLIVFIHILISG